MNRPLQLSVTTLLVAATLTHLATDLIELYLGEFASFQLWLNYAAFVAMPFAIVGLAAIRWQEVGYFGVVAGICYAVPFIYFAHTTLFALHLDIRTYEDLLGQMGGMYTAHGLMMVVGGLLFGLSFLNTDKGSRIASGIFIMGLLTNTVVAVAQVDPILQIVGSTFRNLGLIGLGILSISKPA